MFQNASFALAVREQGTLLGALAVMGTAVSGLTLIGLVVWVVRRPGARAAEPVAARSAPAERAEAAAPEAPEAAPVTLAEPPAAPTAPPGPASGLVPVASLDQIARDINDLMTVVVTHAELLRERRASGKPAPVEPILDAAGQLSGIARRLLALSEHQHATAPAEEPITVRGALVGPGIVRAAPREPARAGDSFPSILDAVEAVRDSHSVGRESHSLVASARRPAAGSRGVVLLVEDEAVLLRATRRTLEQRGYHVLSATSGPEALDRAFEGTPIDVLVTDLSLPGMDGKEVARRLRWIAPDLAVLYTSGYDALTSGLTLAPGAREAFLPKPFTPQELAERLTELCGRENRQPIAQPG